MTSFRVAYDDFKSLRAPKWRLVMLGLPADRRVRTSPPRSDSKPGRARVRTRRAHRRYDPALAGVWNTLGWIMNRKNTARRLRRWRRTMGLTGALTRAPGNRIHPRVRLLPVRASPALLGVVCGPEWTAAGMPAKRNPRESEKETKGERNEEEVGTAVIHDDGGLLRTRGFRRPHVSSR